MMLSKFKLTHQIFLGYSISLISLVGLGVSVYLNTMHTFKLNNNILQAESMLDDFADLTFASGGIVRNIRGVVLFPYDPSYLTSMRKAIDLFHSSVDRLNRDSLVEDLRQRTDKMIEEGKQNEILAEQIITLVNAGKIDQAKVLLQKVRMLQIEEQRDDFLKQVKLSVERDNQEAIKAQQQLISLVIGGTIAATVLSLLAVTWIARQIATKITGVVKIAEQISDGDLTTKVKADANDEHEIGKLLTAFEIMTQKLNLLISQVQQLGIQVTTSATKIAAAGKQLEASATEQVASTNQVVATSKEIAATSGELVKTMEDVALTAQSTATSASSSQKDLGQMEATMRQLVAATGSISSRLEVISEKANNINSVITTITKVADQTNLLSLNAAIEAEKAGEYGLGFAVVAREIRRLADQTAVATLDIEQMVKEMQSAVSTGVMEMDKFTREVERGVEDVNTISLQLGQIICQVQELTPRFEAVNQGMEMQTQGSQQISEAMVQLSESSIQTADSLREINRAIEQLNNAAQGLHREISRFKLDAAKYSQLPPNKTLPADDEQLQFVTGN
jgi:methyl-accepting chemotaxis protein WspA